MLLRQRAFTLIEIMIVIALFGCISMAIMMTMPGKADDNKAEAIKLVSVLQLAIDRAEFEGKIFGLRLAQHYWQLVELCATECKDVIPEQESIIWPGRFWVQVYQRKYPLKRLLSTRFSLQLNIDNEEIKLKNMAINKQPIEPLILLLPGDEKINFQIKLNDSSNKNKIIIKTNSENIIDWSYYNEAKSL